MKGVNYKKLRRFDIGTKPTNPGYQTNTSVVNTGAFASTPGYDMSNDVSTLEKALVPTILTGANQLGNIATNLATNFTKNAGMNAVGKATSIVGALYGTGSMIKDFVDFSDRLKGGDMANMTAESTQTKNGVNYKTYDGFNAQQIQDYTNALNKAGVWSSTLNGLSAGASAGSLGGWLGAAIGGVAGGLTGLFGGLIGGDRRRRKVRDEMNRVIAAQTGYNTQAESEAGSQGLRNDFYGRADEGKTPGKSLNGYGYGMIQTPSGPTYGKIEGLASPDEGQIDMATGETQYNGSKYMNVRDRRADVIPVGITGYANGGAFDLNVGIPGHQMDINGLTFADNARPLFKKNELLKDASAAIDAQIEENNNHKTRDKATSRYIANRLGKMKDQILQQYQLNSQEIANIVNRQTAVLNGNMYSCGKTPRYTNGLIPKRNLDFIKDFRGVSVVPPIPEPTQGPITIKPQQTTTNPDTRTTGPGEVFNSLFGVTDAGVGPGWSVLQGLPYAIGESIAANTHTPYAQNSFVTNATAPQALNVMRSLRYDPSNQLNLLRTATRQNLYNINNAGSLSAGQRAALASSSNIAAAQAANGIYDKAQEVNNAYSTQYADALMKYGQDEASRLQQANAYQQEAYRQAVGAKQKLQAQARKNWYTIGRQALQDYTTMLNTRGMLKLWNAQLGTDKNIDKPTKQAKSKNTEPQLVDSTLSKNRWNLPDVSKSITGNIPSAEQVAGKPVEKLNIDTNRMNAQLARDYENYRTNTDWMEIDPYRLTGKELKQFQKDLKNRDKLRKKNPQSLSARAMAYANRKKGSINKYAVANAYMRNVLMNHGYGSDEDQRFFNYD